jgi:hypothetical protein
MMTRGFVFARGSGRQQICAVMPFARRQISIDASSGAWRNH